MIVVRLRLEQQDHLIKMRVSEFMHAQLAIDLNTLDDYFSIVLHVCLNNRHLKHVFAVLFWLKAPDCV